MRAKIIHITDHALDRWKQRVSNDLMISVYAIIDSVKESRIVKKTEIIPFSTPRHKNTIYAINQDVLFILEAITIDEYNLITVITQSTPYVQIIKNKKKIRTPFKPESKKKKEKRPARNKKVNIDFY